MTKHELLTEKAIRQPSKWEPGNFILRDAWFPVTETRQVLDRPVRRTVHSQPYYIWREKGQYVASEFHPAVAVDIAREASAFTAGTGRYPVVEQYGYVWVWYGNPDNADPALIPDIPFLPRHRSMPEYASGTNYFHCTYELVLENILDLTHIDFVHGNFSGTHESEDDRISVESTSETVTMIRRVKNKATSEYQRDVLGIKEKTQDVTAFTHIFIRSGVCFLHAHFSSAPSMPLMQTNTPESRFLTRANFVFAPHESWSKPFRRTWPKTGPMVAEQDESVLNPQNPRYLPHGDEPDCHTRFDTAGLRYRSRLRDLINRQKQGDFSYLPDMAEGSDIAQVLNVKRLS